MFAVIVTSKEVGVSLGPPVTKAGQQFWVCNEEWVEATGFRFLDKKLVPTDVKTWRTADMAEGFAKGRTGHPWWVKPDTFEVVELKPQYKMVLDRYEAI